MDIERYILRNWLMPLWRLGSPKSMGWAGWLETQAKCIISNLGLHRTFSFWLVECPRRVDWLEDGALEPVQ